MSAPRLAFRAAPLAAVLAGALALSGCSGGDTEPAGTMQILGAARESVAARLDPEPAAPALTRAQLDAAGAAIMEVTREREDKRAYLYVTLERRDDAPGRITVWRTGDNITLALRNDVLIATRGMGGDIESATAPVRGDRPGPATGGERVLFIRGLDNKEQRLSLACDLEDLGPETVEIVGQRHATRHLRERCESDGGQVTNDYWVDSGSGPVWQSRQWAGPTIGYLRLRRLSH